MREIFSQISQIRDRVALPWCLAPFLLALAGGGQAKEAVVYTPWDGEYGAYVIADDPGRVRVVAELVATKVDGQRAGVLALAVRRAPAQARRIDLVLDGEPWLQVELDAAVSDFGVVLPRLNVLRDVGITLRVGEHEALVRELSVAEGVGARFPELDPDGRRDSLQVKAGAASQRWLTFRCASGATLKSASLGADGEKKNLLSVLVLEPASFLIGDVGVSTTRAADYELECGDTAGQGRSVKAGDGG